MAVGKITVFAGPMFSGKTESVVVKLNRARLAKKKILAFKPRVDSRSERTLEDMLAHAFKIKDARQYVISISSHEEFEAAILNKTLDVVAFDEAQFFDSWWIVDAVKKLAWEMGVDVLIAGLDLDYRKESFGQIPILLTIADEAPKLTAVCFQCGKEARFTQRIKGSQEQFQVGGKGQYEARCGECFYEFGTEAS